MAMNKLIEKLDRGVEYEFHGPGCYYHSADASWENGSKEQGHDWSVACSVARKVVYKRTF
jgi:hypothetical protein